MKVEHAQIGTTILGTGLIALGAYIAYGQVESGETWNLWSAIVMLAPVGAGLLFVAERPTERAVRNLAPYMPFLDDPGETDAGD